MYLTTGTDCCGFWSHHGVTRSLIKTSACENINVVIIIIRAAKIVEMAEAEGGGWGGSTPRTIMT